MQRTCWSYVFGKLLPDVSGTDGSESQIIQLDWYAAHRAPRIETFIKNRGHLLLLHGDGTTDYEQVNDMHLHIRLQSMIKHLEIAVFYGQLEDMVAAGEKKAVSHTRRDLVEMVKGVWEQIPHAQISRTGYQQTGPLAPLEGPFQPKLII